MTPPVAPFEIPPIITYAVPGFVLLILDFHMPLEVIGQQVANAVVG